VRNIIFNVPQISVEINAAVDLIVKFINLSNEDTKLIMRLMGFISIGIVFILAVLTEVLEVYWIQQDKNKVYSCLTSLPKNVVSAVADNVRIRRRDAEDPSAGTTNQESNKQEDNLMKIFVAGGSNALSSILDVLINIIADGLVHIMAMVSLYQIQQLVVDAADKITNAAPHLTYIQGAWAMLMGCLAQVYQMIWIGTPVQVMPYFVNATKDDWPVVKQFYLDRYDTTMNDFMMFYQVVRFGNESMGIEPYHGYLDGAKEAIAAMDCTSSSEVPNTTFKSLYCVTPDSLYDLAETLMRAETMPYRVNASAISIEFVMELQDIWSAEFYPVYDLHVYPMYNNIDLLIEESIDSLTASTVPIVATLIAIAFILQVISIGAMNQTSTDLRSVLMLLLHCPVQAVVSTPRVMAVLSGDFGSHRRDEAGRSATFFHSVVNALPDAVVVVVADTHQVIFKNESCDRIFGPDVPSGSIEDFFETRFQGHTQNLIKERDKCTDVAATFMKDQSTNVNLEINAILMGDTAVYTFRDVTQRTRYNTLIAFERSRSDQMLKSILPPSLVPRVQAGEKNISFSVSTASIVFIDIVSFTPWCGSSQADKVMMTLNNMFKRFDANCNSYTTMTRIKCIGDCYMAAGGVFDQVNQPSEHAKEVVSFGLDCLDSMGELNAELGEKLQIRVGVNTGGPIVAGVLGGGVGKPTFEILGPAINLAQQMEHHGVPMAVHVSRSVYEYIYGDIFVVKERGTHQTKSGPVMTYLVVGRKHQP
jgi:class 3 adenylate cyclase